MDAIQQDINYYKTNRKDFITAYAGQHIVIKGATVIGTYKSNTEALAETLKLHELGSFIIERPIELKKK